VRRGLEGQKLDVLAPARHVIFTRSWLLPWEADLFTEWANHSEWPPVVIASPSPMPLFIPDAARNVIQHVHLDDTLSERDQFKQINHALNLDDSQVLMCEGGGELLSFFLKAQLVTELHLTLTPQLIGGSKTPSLVAGEGFTKDNWPLIEWTEIEQHPPEIFLTGTVKYQ